MNPIFNQYKIGPKLNTTQLVPSNIGLFRYIHWSDKLEFLKDTRVLRLKHESLYDTTVVHIMYDMVKDQL